MLGRVEGADHVFKVHLRFGFFTFQCELALFGVFSLCCGGERMEVWLILCFSLSLDHLWPQKVLEMIKM